MIESRLLEEVARVTRQARRLQFRRSLTIGLTLVVAGGLALLLAADLPRWSLVLAVPVISLAALAACLVARITASGIDDPLATARAIEARHASLNARLLTALQEISRAPEGGLGYLQQTVVREAVEHGRQHDWLAAVPALSLRRWTVGAAAATLSLFALMTVFIIAAEPFTSDSGAPVLQAVQPAAPAKNTVTVEPGDVSIERGSSLIVTARYSQAIPASVALVVESSNPRLDGAVTTRSLPMNSSLDDPIVGTRLPSVMTDLTYRVVAQGIESPAYRVTVFDYPQLVRADASLVYPDYAALPVKRIEDTRQVTAVEGTKVSWSLKLNKPVQSARLIAESGEQVVLWSFPDAATIVQGEIELHRSARYKLELVDDAGRRNKHEVEFVMSALKNRAPDLKLVFPRRDLRVSPIEEALVVAQAWDDFGLRQAGITYSLAGRDMTELTLVKDQPGKTNVELTHLLSFEAMKAVPDELLSYHFWADDVGPDGQVRRTYSDMFFAEVRPFEEIFREGQAQSQSEQEQQQQQQQQQQGQQQQIGEGIKEQREIISATWNLIRRETGPEPTTNFKADAQAIREAQEAALERMSQVKERLTDPKSLEHVETVQKHMAQAVSHLAQAADADDPAALKLALPAEQQAYQSLLKLQAREHEVVRNQQQQQRGQQSGQQQQAGPSQQQLNELELRNQENRYETQRMAQESQPQENEQQRETRQALNRLRDLARRQQDLNEKLKEIDLAMKESQTAQEKEELARQLKRLREQQEEMLRDVDELQNRMEQANQNQSRRQEQQQRQGEQSQQSQRSEKSQESQQSQQSEQGQQSSAQRNEDKSKEDGKQAQQPQSLRDRQQQNQAERDRQQVEEARRNIREATEALEKGMTSKALAEGTRAERQLEELREEFRKRASGQFADDVKQMRDQARELAREQERLGEKMEDLDKTGQRSLRDKGERKEVAQALGEQKEKLEGLTDRMRRVTEEAETSEPLLSKQLYDALRDADQQKVDQALDVARQLLDKGFDEEARTVEPQARKGLEDLKRGVEKAADSVLGDEGEALRRAREALDDLAKQVGREASDDQAAGEPLADAKSGRQPREGEEPQRGTSAKTAEKQGDQPGQPGQRGEKQGDQPGQPGQRSEKQGDQPGQPGQRGEKQGDQPGQPGQRGEKQGDQPGRPSQSGEKQGDQPGQPGQPGQGGSPRAGEGEPMRTAQAPTKRPGTLLDQLQRGGTGGASGPHGPITSDDSGQWREWSDRLRDVEEMIDDPQLREEVTKVRDRAQAMRAEFKRHGKTPQWDDVKKLVADPLLNLRDRLDDELARRDRKRDLVPIDRDPVPGQFTDLVREYYERLGTGERSE